MSRRALFLFTSWLLSVCCAYDVHKHMTVEELRSTFHVDHHDLVPEYEVVHIHHVRRRSIETSADNKLNNNFNTARPPNSINNNFNTNSKKEQGKPSETLSFDDDSAHLRLKVFGKALNLSLKKNEGLLKKNGLKLWSVEPNATAQHGVEYVEIPSESHDEIGQIYQDEENQAAVLLRREGESGTLVVEGSVGSDLVIRPIPSRLRANVAAATATIAASAAAAAAAQQEGQEEASNVQEVVEQTTAQAEEDDGNTLPDRDDDEMFLDDDGELSAEVAIDTGLPIKRHAEQRQPPPPSQGHQHIVYKRKNVEDDILTDYTFMEPDRLGKRFRRSAQNSTVLSRRKRDAPYIIYPEILVIVDYDGYRLHGGDNVQIKRYFISFWNGVDLRYKLLKGPRVRISIAGIIISRGRDATPYLERNRVGRDAIDSAAALTDMGKYLFRERRLPVYDIAVAITKLDMCRRQYTGDVCNRGTAGFAYVGGACVVNKRLEKVNSVAIIEDTGGFSGIIVAAHEVGHLLGAVHDGSPPPSYLGGPGAEKCQWTDGYIMSDLRHTERGFRWSPCSISSFHHFLNGDTATCLFNAPHEDDSLPRVLPGKLLSLDAQCRRDRGTSACFKDDRVCAQLFCFDAGSGYCVAYRPAAEGSPCGDGQYCLNGRCVAEHENIIPDYSQNTPSYIRRDGNQGRPLFHEDNQEAGDLEPPDSYPQQYTTTQNPNQYQQYQYTTHSGTPHYTTPQQAVYTTKPYVPPNYYSVSTTKSPYDFQSFVQQEKSTTNAHGYGYQGYGQPSTTTTTTTTQNPYYYSGQHVTTKNPYIGDYYDKVKKITTKSPYDFASFAKNYQDINSNYLKRSYNVASYYDSSNIRNRTAPFNNPRSTG